MPSSTQAQTETDAERRAKLVKALERAQDEVRASRKYIPELEASIKSKQGIIDAQAQRQTLSNEAIASLQKEIVDAQAVIKSLKGTIVADTQEIDYLKKELKQTNQKLARARKVEKYLLFAVGGLILTAIFK